MPKAKSMRKYNHIPYLLRWKGMEIAFLFLFIFGMYYLEIELIKYIFYHENKFGYLSTVYAFLSDLETNFLPFKMWFLAWPYFIVAISLIVFKKWRWYFIGIAWLMTSTLLVADKLFYIGFSSLITTSTFKIANQVWDIKSSIFSMLTLFDLIMVLFFLVFWFIGFLVNRHLDSGLEKSPIAFFVDKALGILFFLVALSSFNTAFYLDNHQVEWVLDNNNQKK